LTPVAISGRVGCAKLAAGMDDVAGLYSRAAPIYSEQGPPYFAHAGQRLVGLTAVQSGDTVLDVATGRGAVLLPAARLVGTSGRVVGIDISPGMIEHTRRAIAREGLAQATVEHMDAASLALFDSGVFSHALCSFAVFWFPDLAQVLGEPMFWRGSRRGPSAARVGACNNSGVGWPS
jgi:O-methyltransferase / aklanonic acid methyltransferase